MLMLLNPKRKRGKKRKASRSRRRRRSSLSSYYSPCSKGGRRRYNKAVRRCKALASAKSNKRLAKLWHGPDSYSPLFSNGRRRRRTRRNPSWVPGYAINPSKVLGSFGAGFKSDVLGDALPAVGGAVLNSMLVTPMISKFIPGSIGSNYWADKIIGLLGAGVIGAGVGMLSPKHAKWATIGAATQVLSKIALTYLPASFGGSGMSGLGAPGHWIPSYGYGGAGETGWAGGISPGVHSDNEGLDAIAVGKTTDNAVAEAIDADGVDTAGLGDYLTTQGAADARPLG